MFDLNDLKKEKNITKLFDDLIDGESELRRLGQYVIDGYKIDEESCKEWKETIDAAMDIAKQVQDTKNFPWPNASNIKFPLIAKAGIEFSSRVLPELIPGERIVRISTVGRDPEFKKSDRAERVERAMSYQLISSPDWYSGVDSLLSILPVVGTVFKKTYYSVVEKRNISEVCPPDEIVVNYSTKSLESARRVTHIIKLSTNEIIERQRRGIFNESVDTDCLKPEGDDAREMDYEVTLLEQHCWYDLDDDGYKEPYVITVHEQSGKVLRIASRIKKVEKNKAGDIVNITPWNYFTDFHFIKSPDGGFYSMGFGQLLLPINKTINSLINQLIDAGTLSVTQGGFLGKGLRIRNGEYRFKPFEWKVLDAASGTDIAKSVYPFPVREPSDTLFKLLSMMIDIGKDFTNATDAMTGTMSASNVSTQTVNTLVEQGSKVYTAINQRLFRSQSSEYKKLYELNYYYLSDAHYQDILDQPNAMVKSDFEDQSCDIHPVADQSLSSMNQRLEKASVLMGLRTADPRGVDLYILKSMQFDSELIQTILPPKDPNEPPPPEVIKTLAEAEAAKAKANQLAAQTQIMAVKVPYEQKIAESQAEESAARVQESVARVWKMQKDAAHGDQKVLIAGGKMQAQESLKAEQARFNAEKDTIDRVLSAKELEVKENEIAAKTALESKKLEIMEKKEGNKNHE